MSPCVLALAIILLFSGVAHSQSAFSLKVDAGAIVSLRRVNDAFPTEYIQNNRRLGDVLLRYRGKDGAWQSVDTGKLATDGQIKIDSSNEGQKYKASYQVLYSPASSNTGPNTNQTPPLPILTLAIEWTINQRDVLWSITLTNVGPSPREIDDLAIPLPIANSVPGVEGNRRVTILKHSLVAGYTSYMFWMRNNNIGPYLMLTPREDTKFEYWDAQRLPPVPNGQQAGQQQATGPGYRVYIHSSAAGAEAKAQGTKWRQPNTFLKLAPGESR